jgi:methylated-DNA-[protein]-cysteine S-methyltransferase
MATAPITTLARGSVTTWAGTTRVEASADGVRSTWLPDWHRGAPAGDETTPSVAVERAGSGGAERHLRQALDELAEYFAGARTVFSVALDPQGPDFFRRVWNEVAGIPYGETRAYGEIARMVGEPDASRAVGAANGANPVAPFVPCHRVVGSDGRLTGYGPGLPLKARLLIMEDAMPDGADDYTAWTGRVTARMGGGSAYLGVRGAGIYCRATCARPLRQRTLPGRIFRSPVEAEMAGFSPCPACQPDAPLLIGE